jgi:hypothetical protein
LSRNRRGSGLEAAAPWYGMDKKQAKPGEAKSKDRAKQENIWGGPYRGFGRSKLPVLPIEEGDEATGDKRSAKPSGGAGKARPAGALPPAPLATIAPLPVVPRLTLSNVDSLEQFVRSPQPMSDRGLAGAGGSRPARWSAVWLGQPVRAPSGASFVCVCRCGSGLGCCFGAFRCVIARFRRVAVRWLAFFCCLGRRLANKRWQQQQRRWRRRGRWLVNRRQGWSVNDGRDWLLDCAQACC